MVILISLRKYIRKSSIGRIGTLSHWTILHFSVHTMSKMLRVIGSLLLLCSIATAKTKFEEETCHSFGPDAHVYPQTTSTLDHKLQYTKAVSKFAWKVFLFIALSFLFLTKFSMHSFKAGTEFWRYSRCQQWIYSDLIVGLSGEICRLLLLPIGLVSIVKGFSQ